MPTAAVGSYEIFYVEAGTGFPLVLIHGLAGDHNAWEAQMPTWAEDHRVLAFDNRGAGQSTQVDEMITTEDMAKDTLALMDAVGINKAHILGRSMGGAIAQHMALLAPERVHTLIMCASFARIDPVGNRVLTNMREVLEWRNNWGDHARHSVQNFVSPEFYNENAETIERVLGLIGGETRLPECYVRQNHACLEHDTIDRLNEIGCPTLIMAGGKDPICSTTATRWMSDGIDGSKTVMFEDSSHFFLMEEAAKFMATVGDWLAEHAVMTR
jgi:pimeloyl-ACP methyl ester carboxylesterase